MNNMIQKNPTEYLLQYQISHVNQLAKCFKTHNIVLDASDTGTGKTYCALILASILGLTPLIICPKSVINNWFNVAKEMGVNILGVSNYEKIKLCKYYDNKFKLVKCPYITKQKANTNTKIKQEIKPDGTIKVKISNTKLTLDEKISMKEQEKYIAKFPTKTLVIIDEAHRCKNSKSGNSKLLFGIKDSQVRMLLLSATITDKVDCFRSFGMLFDFYSNIKNYKKWISEKLSKFQSSGQAIKNQTIEDQTLKIIHHAMFPKCGSRISIKQLGTIFKSNQIVARCYYSDNHNEVDKLYQLINEAILNLKFKETHSTALGQIMHCRMRVEMIKVPIIMDELESALDNGYSCVIFVNFQDTMFYLSNHISVKCCFIYGDQTLNERQRSIDDFQNNLIRVIICITQAGGVGISLHDLHGVPRMSIISPSWSGSDITQVLGRIHRSGAKTPALQRIIYVANSYEEEICKNLKHKLKILSSINDGDLLGPLIPVEHDKTPETDK